MMDEKTTSQPVDLPSRSEVDRCLASVAAEWGRCMDEALDLKLALDRGENPATCVETFYRLYANVPSPRRRLRVVQRYLENQIVVTARNGDNDVLRAQPLRLADETLQAYLQRLLLAFREQLDDQSADFQVRFDYRQDGELAPV